MCRSRNAVGLVGSCEGGGGGQDRRAIDFWEFSVIANKLCARTNCRENNAELGFICILVHGHARDRGVFSPAECFRWEQCCVFAGNNAVAQRGTVTGSFPAFRPHLQAHLGVDHTQAHLPNHIFHARLCNMNPQTNNGTNGQEGAGALVNHQGLNGLNAGDACSQALA